MRKTTKGTVRKKIDKATKMRALAELRESGFCVKQIASRYSVSCETIRTWRKFYNDEVFAKEPRADIAQMKVNTAALKAIVDVNLEIKKQQITMMKLISPVTPWYSFY